MRIKRYIFFLLFVLVQSVINAQQITVDSLDAITRSGSDREKLNAFVQLSNIYKNNDPNRALDYAEQAINVANTVRDEAAQAKAYQAYAAIQFKLGNFTQARQYYQQALILFGSAQNEKGVAEVQNALGGIYYAQGNLPLAVENYLNVLRYYEKVNNAAGLVNIYASLAALYERQNNFTKSIEYNLKAIALYESASNKFQALVGYDQIGNAYLKQNNLSKAAEYFNKSLRSYTELNNKTGVASTFHQLGNIAARQQNYPLAISYYSRSLAISESIKTQPLSITNLSSLAEVYISLKDYDKAAMYYKKVISIAKPADMRIELEQAYQGLSQIYELTKQKDQATTFNALSRELKDSLYNDSTLKKLSDMQLRYEAEKKQRQIELLSKEQQLKDTELLKQRQINRLVLVATIIIAAVLLVLIYFFIQNKRFANHLQQRQNELVEKNNEVLRQKEQVDQLNSVKDRFFSIVSHDLRNSLTTMKLYFDLIANPEYKPDDQKEITQQIAGSVENTIDLLENLLVWASAQIKGLPIHIQKLNIHSLAQENINLLNGNAAQKNITLINAVPEDSLAYGDMDMINLVVRNLVSNAIKFTPEHGVISIDAQQQRQFCRVSVQDNGIGISAENLEKLFDQHQHPTTKGTANEKGTGLGLMLCKDFIERNNGTIWVESEKQKGTTFYFTLPLEA